MPLSCRENYLRALEFRGPEWIPAQVEIHDPAWLRHGRALEEVVLGHPRLYPGYRPGSFPSRPIDPWSEVYLARTDDWGCIWRNLTPGTLGQVIGHPLEDWSALATFRPPDPDKQYDWEGIRASIERGRAAHKLTRGCMSITQGGLFDRLQFLRGMENLLMDFATQTPELDTLIQMLVEYNARVLRRYLSIGIDQMHCHGDVGGQTGLIFSPEAFRRYLKPAYEEIFLPARKAGVHVTYSSDGYMLDVVDDLVDCGVTLHDPEVRVNTAAGIRRVYGGKLCAMIQLDTQRFSAWSPEQIRRHVEESVRPLEDPRGGLMVYAYVGADVPLCNVDALCTAVEQCCGLPGPPGGV